MRHSLLLCVCVAWLGSFARADEVDDQYQFIAGLYDRGMHEVVVREAATFLDEHAPDERADLVRYRLALSLFELERLDEAAAHFERLGARREFPFRVEALFRLGECELQRGRHDAAAEALDRALALETGYLAAPVTFVRAEADFRRERFADAEPLYERVLELEPDADLEYDARFALAWCAFRLGEHARTVARIEDLAGLRPEDPRDLELAFLLGETWLEAGEPREALAAYSRVDRGPWQDAALRGAGFAAAALDDHAAAVAHFDELLRRFPRSRFAAEAALHRGIHLIEDGRADEAWKALSTDLAGAGAETRYWRARAAIALGDDERALAEIERGLAGAPDGDLLARLSSVRGDVLVRLGRATDAVSSYREAGSDYALYAAAVTALNAGEAREARELSARVLEAAPQGPYVVEARLVLGEALFAEGAYADAERELLAVARSRDASEEATARARSRVAWCRYLSGDLAGAVERFGEVAQAHDGDVADEARYMQGRAAAEAGDDATARAAWSRHLQEHPDGAYRAEVLLRLARVQPDAEAVASLRALLAEHPGDAWVPDALYDLAERHVAAGRLAPAERRYEELLESFADHALGPAARYGLAWCRFERGEYEASAEELDRLVADARTDDALREAAWELSVWCGQRLSDPDRAVGAWLAIVERTDDEARHVELGRAVIQSLVDAGRLAEADALGRTLADELDDGGARAETLVELVYVALERGDLDAAERAALEAVSLVADDATAEACFFAAEALFERGDDARASKLYARAHSRPGALVDQALYKDGFARLRAGDPAAAFERFARLVEEHGDSDLSGEATFLAGEALFRLDRFADAAGWLRRAREEHPRHEVMPKVLFREGVALCQLERWSEAEQRLADLARQHADFPNAAEGELWRARALAAQSKERAAREAFERVIAIDRGVLAARARIGLGGMHLTRGDTEAALSEFLKVVVLYAHDDEVGSAMLLAGQCLEALGDPDRARSQYAELVDRFPDSTFARTARERLGTL